MDEIYQNPSKYKTTPKLIRWNHICSVACPENGIIHPKMSWPTMPESYRLLNMSGTILMEGYYKERGWVLTGVLN